MQFVHLIQLYDLYREISCSIKYFKKLNMSPFKSSASVKGFTVICLTINIVFADSKDQYHRCIRQIQMAFGYNNTATGCLKYAVKYYTKGQNIKFEDDLITNQNQSDGSSSRSDSLVLNSSILDQSFEPPNKVHGSDEQTSIRQKESPVQVYSFDDLVSSRQKEPPTKVHSFKELMYGRQKELPIAVHNFDDLISIRQKEPPIEVHNFDDLFSSRQKGHPVAITSFGELIDSDQTGLQVGEQNYENMILNYQEAEQNNTTNYAMLYHKEMESMIQGGGVPRRYMFCTEFFNKDSKQCLDNLVQFGDSSKSAVKKAFMDYNLTNSIDNKYIHKYVEIISERCKALQHSKNPQAFCRKVTKQRNN